MSVQISEMHMSNGYPNVTADFAPSCHGSDDTQIVRKTNVRPNVRPNCNWSTKC